MSDEGGRRGADPAGMSGAGVGSGGWSVPVGSDR